MPKPKENKIPGNEEWRFTQRECHTDELLSLAKNIVNCNNQPYNSKQSKGRILSFLSTSDKEKAWSDYWVTIIHTMGLGYISSEDNLLHKTCLADFLAQGNSVNAYYYYWALRFQFPFADKKHKEFKDMGIAIQPAISILEHLVRLFKIGMQYDDPFAYSFLTYDEIVSVLMKSKSNSIYEVYDNVNKIIAFRAKGYNYHEYKISGYDSALEKFANRARLYLEKFDLIRFDTNNQIIYIKDWKHYNQILVFLSYRRNAFLLTSDDKTWINFFEDAYNRLNPNPNHLYMAVQSVSDNGG